MISNEHLNVSLQQALGQEYRSPESFVHHCTIQVAWGGLEPVISWCKTELVGDWRWQVREMSSDLKPGSYNFYFDSDRDYCAFSMKFL
jgi:hypothetical protein